MRWDDLRRADRGPARAADAPAASPRQDERRWIRDVAARAPRRALPRPRGAVTRARPAPPSPTCWPATASTSRPAQTVARALDLARARRCCSSCSARSSSATRGRCCASSCPARRRAFYDARARPPPRRLSPTSRSTEAKRVDALLGIQAPGDVRELAGVDPERDRALRPRAPPDPRGDDEEALVLDAVADRGARRPGGHGARGVRGLRARRAVPRPARPGRARGAGCAPSRTR